jgi:uncharacterized membrane protein
MNHADFLKQLRHDDIVAAIRDTEAKTSGEIRVFISHKTVDDPVVAAQKIFEKLGMTKTRERNGVLFFVAPKAQKFAVIGDSGVHQKCGDGFWKEISDEMSGYFRRSEFSQGLIHGIQKAGESLARHFPRKSTDTNQLPDGVEHD